MQTTLTCNVASSVTIRVSCIFCTVRTFPASKTNGIRIKNYWGLMIPRTTSSMLEMEYSPFILQSVSETKRNYRVVATAASSDNEPYRLSFHQLCYRNILVYCSTLCSWRAINPHSASPISVHQYSHDYYISDWVGYFLRSTHLTSPLTARMALIFGWHRVVYWYCPRVPKTSSKTYTCFAQNFYNVIFVSNKSPLNAILCSSSESCTSFFLDAKL